MQGLECLGQHRLVVPSGCVHGGQRQQDAALRIVADVGVGCRGKLASHRDVPFPLGLLPLVDRHQATHQGHHQRDPDAAQLPPQPTVGPSLPRGSAGPARPALRSRACAARLDELPLQGRAGRYDGRQPPAPPRERCHAGAPTAPGRGPPTPSLTRGSGRARSARCGRPRPTAAAVATPGPAPRGRPRRSAPGSAGGRRA